MAVKLRLKRMGKKKRPFYRIVAADSRAPRDGRFIELVGTYDPITKPHRVDYEEERVLYWLTNGAQPTDTVKSLLSGKGLWLKWTLIKQGADEAKIASELEAWEKIQVEKEKRAEAKAASKAKEAAKKKAEAVKEAEEEEVAKQETKAEPAPGGTRMAINEKGLPTKKKSSSSSNKTTSENKATEPKKEEPKKD